MFGSLALPGFVFLRHAKHKTPKSGIQSVRGSFWSPQKRSFWSPQPARPGLWPGQPGRTARTCGPTAQTCGPNSPDWPGQPGLWPGQPGLLARTTGPHVRAVRATSGPSGPHVRAVWATCPGRPGHMSGPSGLKSGPFGPPP